MFKNNKPNYLAQTEQIVSGRTSYGKNVLGEKDKQPLLTKGQRRGAALVVGVALVTGLTTHGFGLLGHSEAQPLSKGDSQANSAMIELSPGDFVPADINQMAEDLANATGGDPTVVEQEIVHLPQNADLFNGPAKNGQGELMSRATVLTPVVLPKEFTHRQAQTEQQAFPIHNDPSNGQPN